MRPLTFGYVGKWFPQAGPVQSAAHLVKTDQTPVGIERVYWPTGVPYQPFVPYFRVVTNVQYGQAVRAGTLAWTAIV
jgi:hypothetical protein